MEREVPKRSAFSERDFYLEEFRNRTLGIALPSVDCLGSEGERLLGQVISDLLANSTRVVLLGADPETAERLTGGTCLRSDGDGWVGSIWRRMREHPAVALAPESGTSIAAQCSRVALRLGLAKLIWLGQGGVLTHPETGRRISLLDLAGLDEWLEGDQTGTGGDTGRSELLLEIRNMLVADLPSVSACLPGELANELFTYAGSGTLYSRDGYTRVRFLALDDFDAAEHLILRGVEEGFLLDRSDRDLESALTNGFGAFVEGKYLAGIAALVPHPKARAGEVASLYALTRFVGEGIGAHLLRFALRTAAERGYGYVFACTTSERVVAFFSRMGFKEVSRDQLPDSKWLDYNSDRLEQLRCLRHDVA
jgi:N-acetylglutamate synthase-like GNAT family acetyltransferase